MLQERQERKCVRLEQAVQEEEKLYGAKLTEIMDQHMVMKFEIRYYSKYLTCNSIANLS